MSKATSYSVLEWSEKLLVYPDRLDIHLDVEKLLGSTLTKSIEENDKVISILLEQYKKGILFCYGKGVGKVWEVKKLEEENKLTN